MNGERLLCALDHQQSSQQCTQARQWCRRIEAAGGALAGGGGAGGAAG